jgi:DNA-binding transcriptional MocR family regulator
LDVSVQYRIAGADASEIAASVETGILAADLEPGDRLPPVRELARTLGVSPTTVAAAYSNLRGRGLIVANGRRGTSVSPRPPLPTRLRASAPEGVRDVANGSPDPELLPSLTEVLAGLKLKPRLYGEPTNVPALIETARRYVEADGIDGSSITIVGGALDGIERVLQAHLRPGDRVIVEDPGYSSILDLLKTLGLTAAPVPIDDSGPVPGAFERTLALGASACIITPRAQNPVGAALDKERTTELRAALRNHPRVLIIEDDHASATAGAPAFTLTDRSRPRWAVVRSVSKALGPDLRLAFVAGDEVTVGRVEGRMNLGPGWVSHILQHTVLALWNDPNIQKILLGAVATYASRRNALLQALTRCGIEAHGRSGLNVWIPVKEEASAIQGLLNCGWLVNGGERYRIKSPPAIRVTTARLEPRDASRFAADMARCLVPSASRTV